MSNNKKNRIEIPSYYDPSDISETFFNDYFIQKIPSYKKLSKKHFLEVNQIARKKYFIKNHYPYPKRLDLNTYYKEKIPLQIELVKLQNYIREKKQKVIILFEGRDAAGKGATIRRFMEHLDPKSAKVIALDKPSEIEEGQWYFQRYVEVFPSSGELILFDRSWYNRAGVEKVLGFCTKEQYQKFLIDAPDFEKLITSSDIKIIKLYFSVSDKEQSNRITQREKNPLKNWKLSEIDYLAQSKWPAYTEAKEKMFLNTHKEFSKWWIIKSDDKMRARINAMKLVLSLLDYDNKNEKILNYDPWIVSDVSEIWDINV